MFYSPNNCSVLLILSRVKTHVNKVRSLGKVVPEKLRVRVVDESLPGRVSPRTTPSPNVTSPRGSIFFGGGGGAGAKTERECEHDEDAVRPPTNDKVNISTFTTLLNTKDKKQETKRAIIFQCGIKLVFFEDASEKINTKNLGSQACEI